MTTIEQPVCCATSSTCAQKVRQRSWGSTPRSSTIPPVAGGSAHEKVFAGQSMRRVVPAVMRTCGRVEVKS